MHHTLFLLTLTLLLTQTGCAKHALDPEINFEPPAYVEQLPAQEVEDSNNLGSIFGRGDNPLFADRKAFRVHDIVTINITESATATSTGSKALTESDQSTFGPGVFTQTSNPNSVLSRLTNNVNDVAGIGFGQTSNSTYAGQGQSSRAENFTTSVSARIVKVLNNGNYFVSGKRELLINGEKQIMQISGVIRPYDIAQNNTIPSSKIADAKILYRTEGDVERATQKGWASKMLAAIWPF
jgi:flagellar L-ring protein FlgH